MQKSQFDKLDNFTYQEVVAFYKKKGFSEDGAYLEIRKISFNAMKKVQAFRTRINRSVHFNSITEGKHSKNSQHPLGKAFDLRIGGRGNIKWNDMVEAAIEVGFKGIGFYPWWNTPGLHLDDRDGSFQMWIRDESGKYVGFI